ncbi:MAG: DUF3025 domain-containing protein [Gammaproteobacteria bacterium]|nr:DUF3025 domain-containing protein [Gammaproteobacteria bacterium]
MVQQGWLPYFQGLSPAYQMFSWFPQQLFSGAWPTIDDYNTLFASRHEEFAIRFVPQGAKALRFIEGYEPRIFLSGEIQTRSNNWHDFFNMLIWCNFPTLKSQLNKLQYSELLKRETKDARRSALENFLTLFDENGVVILSSEDSLLSRIRTMQWKDFFWNQRRLLSQKLRCYVFGHSLHEKLLNPYIGMVGHALLLKVADSFFDNSLEQQFKVIEQNLCALDFELITSKALYPIPVLGFPGWCVESNDPSFYDNKDYFRPQRLTNTMGN